MCFSSFFYDLLLKLFMIFIESDVAIARIETTVHLLADSVDLRLEVALLELFFFPSLFLFDDLLPFLSLLLLPLPHQLLLPTLLNDHLTEVVHDHMILLLTYSSFYMLIQICL